MSERDANDVGGASQSHSQTETSLPDPPSRRPTIIRPASKSFAAVSQNEQVPDSLLTSSSAPLTPGTRPPLVKHRSNEKVKPECPPRPVSTLHSQSGSTSSFKTAGVQPVKKKLEITVVDARPMSENGITSSPSVLYHPTSGTLNFSASAKEEPEKDLPTQYDASLPTNVAGDNANGSGISRKPSGSLKQMKPTIIRQNATRQQPPDVESATEVTVSSLLHPQKIQNLSPVSSPQEPHSIATAAPSATPPPNPKPRTRELTALISDLQKPNQSAADSKPVRPSRPSSSPRSDKKTLVHETTVQASAIKDDLTKAANTSSSNLPPPAPSSAPRQAPPRPLRTPPSLTRKNKDRDQLDGNAQPETKTEKQFAQTRSTDVSNQRESQIDGAGHRRESSETITLPKPKPKPKPKSLTSTSSDCSEEIKSPTHIDNNNSTNKQLLPSNMPIQTTTLNTENSHQEDHLKQNLSLVTTTVDRTGQGDHSSVTEKSKPSSAALNARIESSIKYEKDEKISPTLQSSTKNQRNPSVESPVSLQDTLVPAVFQPPLKTDTNPSINSGVKIKTQVQQKPGSHGSPPLRPVTAAPVRGNPYLPARSILIVNTLSLLHQSGEIHICQRGAS